MSGKNLEVKRGARASRQTGQKERCGDCEATLDWIANFVTQINSLESKRGEERIELIARDDDNIVITMRVGKTMPEAFRKCLTIAMKQLPKP